MPPLLDLTPDELLTTTRAVRKRLDLTRPVDDALIRECLEIAVQAPTGSNAQGWHFVVVTDPAKRAAIAEQYGKAWEAYQSMPQAAGNLGFEDPQRAATQDRVMSSAEHLAAHLAEVPVHVIACHTGRLDNVPALWSSSIWGSVFPAVWSFMLAARARGLGTTWTTLHLVHEREVADIVGIPYDEVCQGVLVPVAHTIGTDFKPAPREDLDRVVHWNSW